MRAVRQFLWAYRAPLIAVALAALTSLLFWSLGPRVPLGLFIAAVMVSAWQGGLRSSLVATGLSTVLLAVIGHYQAPGPADDLVLRLGLFVLVGLIAGYLSQQCRQAIRAVDHVHDILGGGGIALISADGEGRVTSLNPLARTLTGVGQADAHGRPLGQVFHLVHGAARQPWALPPAGAAQELPEGALLVGENGGETAVEGTVAPARDTDGRPAGLTVVFRDCGGRAQASQELRQRADRFRALAGHAPTGLMVLDAEGRCVFSNPAAQAACGCTADESLGEGWSRHVQREDRDRLLGDWLKAVVGKAPFADEFRVAAPSGGPRWLRVRSAPMLADSGEVLGHVAALEDVTERRRAEEALADARREAEEHLQEWSAAEKKAEEALRAARADFERQSQEQAAARQSAEQALRTAGEEGERKLREEAARRQQAEDELRQRGEEIRRLRAEHDASREEVRAALAEKDGTAEALRKELERLREEAGAVRQAHDRAQELLAAKGGNEDSLRKELERLGEDGAALRQSHDRLQALLGERGGNEEALRQELDRLAQEAAEARDARDRLQALLAAKANTEESLRQEIERLQGEAAARRQAEEAHERLRWLLGEKEQREEALRRQAEEAHERAQAALGEKEQSEASLRRELARHQDDLREQQRAAEELRRDKEFLEGVIDGSPAGIFAHDRDGRCRVWNPALEQLLGRPRADALGRAASELFPAHPPRSERPAEDAPASENGAARSEGTAVAVIGRSELLESAHAPIRDPAGEVVGGVALVRELPMPALKEDPEELAPTTQVAGENGTAGHTNRADGRGAAASRLGDMDWLAFN
jgi:PAS domain S-box-containing protein